MEGNLSDNNYRSMVREVGGFSGSGLRLRRSNGAPTMADDIYTPAPHNLGFKR